MLLAECYGLDGFVLADVDEAGEIRTGLPLLAPPRLPGRPHRLVSLPFTDVLQPLAPLTGADGLVSAIDDFRREFGAARIELRGDLSGARPEPVTAVIHTLALDGDVDSVERGFSKHKRRNMRLAERKGLAVRRAESERDLTETFYRLHLETRRRLGVPTQPKRFFKLLWRRIVEPGKGFVLVTERAGVPVAAAVFLVGNGTVVYKYSASAVSAQRDKPNDLLLWTAIHDACEQGVTTFDFGRSDLENVGLRDFKSSWGAVEKPLVYASIGDAAATGAPAPRLLGEIIRRSPMWVARTTGELLYRFAA